jgi:predicted nucleic acid-binding protein
VSRYLLDTLALAEVMKASPSRRFVRRLTMVPPSDRWTCAVSVAELLYAARRANQADVMKDVVSLVASVRVAPFDVAAARVYAKIRASMEWAGENISISDLQVAAIAKSAEFVLVTLHPEKFKRLPGLHVEDWTVAEGALSRSRPGMKRSNPPARR